VSTDWTIFCLDCQQNLTCLSPSISKKDLAALIRHAGALAALAPLFAEAEWLEMKDCSQYVDPKDFVKHGGHRLTLRDEYGRFDDSCGAQFQCCPQCDYRHTCNLPKGHEQVLHDTRRP
jgi:hypothetical protein